MNENRILRWPWVIYGVTMTGLAVAVALSILNDTFDTFVVIAIMMMLGYGTIGAFLASRVPSNPIGWLMIVISAGFAVVGVTDEYLTYTFITDPGTLPAPVVAAWLSNFVFYVTFLPILGILLLFPTGTVLSPRWRFVLIAIVASGAMGVLAAILTPGPVETDSSIIAIDNPTGVEALEPVIGWVSGGAALVLAGSALASVAAVVVRYRRAEDEQRRQIRWLAYVTSVALLFLVVGLASVSVDLLSSISFYGFFLSIGVGIPIAIGYAILRYRLYDIDLVVKKGVTFSLVALSLTGLYLAFVAVATVGNLSRLVFGVVLVALTFRPVLQAARSVADRIVYGRRATPYEVLSEFSERMSETYSTEDVLPRMAKVLQERPTRSGRMCGSSSETHCACGGHGPTKRPCHQR